mgnify:CR=1 FL=1
MLNKDRVCANCNSSHEVKLVMMPSGVNRWRCKKCREKTKKFFKKNV